MAEAVKETVFRTVDIAEIAKNWKRRGFRCEIHTAPCGKCWANRAHEDDELIMALDGDVEVDLRGETVHLKPGEELLVPAGMLHTMRNAGNSASQWLSGMAFDCACTD